MAPKAKDLEPIKDPKVVERYLKYILDFREQVSCLIEPGPLRFEAFAKRFHPENFGLELDITEESYGLLGRAEHQRLDNVPKNLRFSFNVNDVLFFAHGVILGRKSRHLELTVDHPLYKMQRREAVRVKVLDSHKGSVEVGGKSYLLHDLSASGLSFVVMNDDVFLFPAKRVIRSCKLNFAGLHVPVDLEVVGSSGMKRDKERLFKVGFRFLGLTASVEQHLAREAYLYTHKIWSRWL